MVNKTHIHRKINKWKINILNIKKKSWLWISNSLNRKHKCKWTHKNMLIHYINQDMHIKISVEYHSHSLHWRKENTLKIIKHWWDYEETRTLIPCWRKWYVTTVTRKAIRLAKCVLKMRMWTSSDTAISLLDMHPGEALAYIKWLVQDVHCSVIYNNNKRKFT